MNSSRAVVILGGVVIVGFGLLFWRQEQMMDRMAQMQVGTSAPPQGAVQPVQGAAPKPLPSLSTVSMDFDVADRPSRGRADAPVVFLEFSDFQCPFCGRYVRDTYPRLESDYIATGKVRYVFRQFPLEGIHPDAMNAAIAASCAASQGKFWELHDRLFANSSALTLPSLLTYGAGLGMNEASYSTCINSRSPLSEIQADKTDALRGELTGTPGFFVGRLGPDGRLHAVRRISGAQPYSLFQSAIDDVLAGK